MKADIDSTGVDLEVVVLEGRRLTDDFVLEPEGIYPPKKSWTPSTRSAPLIGQARPRVRPPTGRSPQRLRARPSLCEVREESLMEATSQKGGRSLAEAPSLR